MSLDAPMSPAAAFAVAACIALAAWRARSLTRSGACAACIIGALALCHRTGTGLFLIAWFVLAAVLSRWGKRTKALRVAGIVDKGARRDWWQVLANGGMFAACVAFAIAFAIGTGTGARTRTGAVLPIVAACGALVAAGADTWATEIGTLVGGTPWSLRTRSAAPPGTSGAITVSGTLAAAGAAVGLALLAALLHVIGWAVVPAVSMAGFAGAMTDSVLGAFGQERRWCASCASETEQTRHDCGADTDPVGGFRGLTNDVVNLLCTVVGAALAALLARG